MLEISGILTILSALEQVIKLKAAFRRSTKDVVKDLRFIRFNESGIVNLIKSLIGNEHLEGDESLRGFCSYSEPVKRAVNNLYLDCEKIALLT